MFTSKKMKIYNRNDEKIDLSLFFDVEALTKIVNESNDEKQLYNEISNIKKRCKIYKYYIDEDCVRIILSQSYNYDNFYLLKIYKKSALHTFIIVTYDQTFNSTEVTDFSKTEAYNNFKSENPNSTIIHVEEI